MNRFIYSIFVSSYSSCLTKKIVLIIILSYYFGLLMPFYCLANIEVFIDSINTIEIFDSEYTYIVNLSVIQGNDYTDHEEVLSNLELRNFTVITSFRAKMLNAGKAATVSVSGVREDFGSFERFEIIEGTFSLNEISTTVSECVIAFSIAKKYDLHLGDQIIIDGTAYIIVGIVNNFNYYKTIYIPLSSAPVAGDSMSDKLYLHFYDLPTINQVKVQLTQLYPNRSIYSIELASDIARQTLKSGVSKSARILLIGAISIVIAILNTFLIISGKYEENKRSIAVKLALGATKFNVSVEIFYENILYIYIANFILLITSPILAGIVPLNSDFSFSWRVHVVIFGISTFLAIGMSAMLIKKVTKASISTLLKEE